VKKRAVPSFVVRLLVRRNPKLRNIVKLLDVDLNATGEEARRVRGWSPRSSEERSSRRPRASSDSAS
jgi:dihydroflavonol-4-reductase